MPGRRLPRNRTLDYHHLYHKQRLFRYYNLALIAVVGIDSFRIIVEVLADLLSPLLQRRFLVLFHKRMHLQKYTRSIHQNVSLAYQEGIRCGSLIGIT